jgi:hypothetical protein
MASMMAGMMATMKDDNMKQFEDYFVGADG